MCINHCGTHVTRDECELNSRLRRHAGNGGITAIGLLIIDVFDIRIIIPWFYLVCPNNITLFHTAQVSFPDTCLESKTYNETNDSLGFHINMRIIPNSYLLLCAFSSPRNQPVIAVNTKVREFETGTAKDISVF
jgi:hypothetical protein